jgi:hypothetical protein
MTTQCLETAQLSRSCGISVVPPAQDGSKRPDVGSWVKYQSTRANEAEIDRWYSNGRTGVGWVTGKASGNLEVIDFDDRSAFAEYRRLCEESGLVALFDKILDGYCEHSPNGAHIAYRCSEIEGNQKLAQSKEHKALIETRGEGGFIIVAPSHGGVNVKGPYLLQSGGPDKIATITPEERRSLFDIAKMLDESIKPESHETTKTQMGGRPGDDFNQHAEWGDVLKGWKRVSGRLGVISWRRPGKDIGISATTNHGDSDLLYVFSTSTEFEANRGYSKFSSYALLEHGGDFKAAAKELLLQGYGVDEPDRLGEVDLSGIMARFGGQEKHKHPPLDELLRVPGLVGELAEWISLNSPKPQPVLALGAAIAAMSTIIARKIQYKSGLRSNIYCLGVGHTGCGKDAARKCIKLLFEEIGAQQMIGESFASGTAIESAMATTPAACYLIDELGHLLGSLRDDGAPGYAKAIVPMMLKFYTSSESSYRCTTYADKERNSESQIIKQPSLSFYATTVPSNLFSGLTKQHMADGFLSRLLVFESSDPDPFLQSTDRTTRSVPKGLVDGFSRWLSAPINPHASGDLEALEPDPMDCETTPEARSVFDWLELQMRARRKVIRESGGDQGPWTRVQATAKKLALIRGCGIALDRPEITESDARWGCDLAWLLTDTFLDRIGANVFENKDEERSQRVLAIVKTCVHGVTKSELTRKTQWLKRSDRAEIVASLIEGGDIVQTSVKPTTYKSS